ncbi:MAG: pyridoxal phosphate-dependent aminotransferase [Oscillospiraceae bacterium]|nr:pyridoxal phosphate-dependent aminotransferase [Oscillospiraceae bacterium]
MYNQTAYELGTNGCIIRELGQYGDALAARIGKENVFNFCIGNPSLPTPKAVQEAFLDILQHTDSLALHSYTPAIGSLACRQAIADNLNQRFSANATADDLIIGCGAAPELAAVFHALAFPGSEILTVAPYFPEYKPLVEASGAAFRVVPAAAPDFQIPMAALEAMLTPNTAAVLLNSPNNPSGVVYTRKTLEALSRLLTRKGEEFGHPIYIVSDEPYRELAYGVEVPFVPGIYPNTIVCYSYSKSLSLPGERIGYVYIPKNAADAQALYHAVEGGFRATGHICAPSLLQAVIARCAHLTPDLTMYDKNRTTLYNALTEFGYQVAKPDGAFYLFVKAPGGNAMAFVEKAKEQGLLVVPGDDFGCPEYFRMCYCVSHDQILRSLPIFRRLAK